VSRAALEDKLCRDLGTNIPPELPDPAPDKRWPRVPCCPFCGGRKTAAVNYDISWFKCFRCGNEVSAGMVRQHIYLSDGELVSKDVPAGADVAARFRAQIDQAARNVQAKYGRWMPDWDARSFAAERVLVYAGEPRPKDSRAGKLDDWETQVNGDPDQLDRYVLRALTSDLLNYSRGKVRARRSEMAAQIALVLNIKPRAARRLLKEHPDDWPKVVEMLNVTKVTGKSYRENANPAHSR